MIRDISVSVSPIGGSLPLLVLAVLAVLVLTLWPYTRRLRGKGGRWRFFALALRLLALLLCVLAALRPSVFRKEKKQQASSLVVLFDTSTSMLIGDEVRGQSRWGVEQDLIKQLKAFSKTLGPDVDARFYGFDSKVSQPKETELENLEKPKGRETALGSAMDEVRKRQENESRRISRLVILSDFTSNNGTDPLDVAQRLKSQHVPIIAVGLGTESAGTVHKDIALRDIITSPTVFVKNRLDVRGSMVVRGFANQQLPIALYVEGQTEPVAKTTVKIPEGVDVIPITGLAYNPQTPGEKRITIKAAPQEGELVVSNNEISSFVSVLAGGLGVRFLQGPNFTWDFRYLSRAIGTAQELHLDGVVIRRAAQEDTGELDDSDFVPGKYNVFVLSDLPATHLTPKQHGLLVEAVKKGAGLIMLGGRASFGAGGWADTPLAEILPCEINAGDGQYEPEEGIKLVPTNLGLDSFILQIGATRAETARLWEALPPILGTNRFGERKASAAVLASGPDSYPEPIMMSIEIGSGRVLAYGGETWVWARSLNLEEGRIAHRKFWRQAIFWLSHKEDDGENHVKLTVEPRRVAVGGKLDFTVTARDAKGAPIPNVNYDESKIEREGPAPAAGPIGFYNQGDEGRATKYAVDNLGQNLGQPGNYTATAIARKGGKEVGRDTARFLVYQDDRELENPSADLKLAREMASLTEGEAVTPEKLMTHLKGIDHSSYTEYLSPQEYKVWDNFPFLLVFAALLTLEWWLRKRHGWV
jgi:uncharacterized membrane protein